MGANTAIEWADHTLNFWVGCEPVSEGCDNCYAARALKRYGHDPHERRRVSEKTIQKTLRVAEPGDKIFVNSWSDFFDPKAFSGWRREATRAMVRRPDLIFLLLTKRPAEMAQWAKALQTEAAYSYDHIWIGVTAENQARADERIPVLLNIDWPGKKWISVEPMIGPVDVASLGWRNTAPQEPRISWTICGGESGPNARPMHPAWARDLRDQCVEAGAPFFFKSWGAWAPWVPGLPARSAIHVARDGAIGRNPGMVDPHYRTAETVPMGKVGTRKIGRLLDGRTWAEVPGKGK